MSGTLLEGLGEYVVVADSTALGKRDITSSLAHGINATLFPPHLELVPQLNEVYELELAFHESRILSEDEIVRNGAYFARVRDNLTRHFLMCSGEPVRLPQHSSSRLRSFFQTNQFKTGYATHGLFPYRVKLHPQMIKGLMKIMGLKFLHGNSCYVSVEFWHLEQKLGRPSPAIFLAPSFLSASIIFSFISVAFFSSFSTSAFFPVSP